MENQISILNLIFSAITAFCALYLSLIALRHTAKPKINARIKTKEQFKCGETTKINFELFNEGHWYAKPAAMSIAVHFDLDPSFELTKVTSGTEEQYVYDELKTGSGGTKTMRLKGIHLIYGQEPVPCWVYVTTPEKAGKYAISIIMLSDNGADTYKTFWIECL